MQTDLAHPAVEPITVPELRRHLLRADAGETADAVAHQRTVKLGSHMALLFESRQTLLDRLVRFAAIEGISDDAALQAECDVYNSWLTPDTLCVTVHIDPMSDENWQALSAALKDAFYLDVGPRRVTAEWPGPLGPECQALFALPHGMRRVMADESNPMAVGVAHRNATLWANIKGNLREALAQEVS